MNGKDISDIIWAVGLIGWVPIWVLFNGLSKVILAIRGKKSENGGFNVDIKNTYESNKKEAKDENDD